MRKRVLILSAVLLAGICVMSATAQTTGILTLEHNHFRSAVSDGPPAGWDKLTQFAESATSHYVTGIQFPEGAVLKKVVVCAKMNWNYSSLSERFEVRLQRMKPAGTRESWVLIRSKYNAGKTGFWTIAANKNLAIKNTPYSLVLEFPGKVDTGNAIKYEVSYIRLEYQVP